MVRITINRFCTHCLASGKEVPAVVSYTNDRGAQFLACIGHKDIAKKMGHETTPVKSQEIIHEE